jgi:predicted HTH domain antitoxin
MYRYFLEAKMSLQLIQVQDLVKAQLYDSEDQVVQDAFRHFLRDRPDLRIRVAVHRYRTDEELSLARAAAIAGVSLERMKEILERNGVSLRLGPASLEEARAEVATLDEWFNADSD